jgi:hypothetical protein
LAHSQHADIFLQGYQVFGTVRSDVDGDALCRLSSNITAVNMDVTDGNSISAALLQVISNVVQLNYSFWRILLDVSGINHSSIFSGEV